MGKYMRKTKDSGELAVMEVAAAPLGVRTRARALALQRLQKQQAQAEGTGAEYLELRSRRLEKLPPPAEATRRCGGRKAAAAAAAAQEEEEAEASHGENVLELEAMERSTRETTPCSLINSGTISTPGSTTRSSHSSQRRVKAPPVHTVPSSKELNEFFADEQRRHQQAFMDKYNFDPVNDCPLPGKYEWVKLD